MLIKKKVKFVKVVDGKKRFCTTEVCGRTQQELDGRIGKVIFYKSIDGWELR